ncbi:hypothetical protein UT300009_30840 [Paraclostridium bifermentans]
MEEEKELDSKEEEKTLDDINSPDDLTIEIVKQYMRIEHNLDDFELKMYLKSALSYVRKYVGIEDTSVPLDVDLIMPTLMLISHFYENKTPINNNNSKLDSVFDSLLWMNRGVVL